MDINKQPKIYNESPNLLLRVDKTEKLKQDYENGYITFSCAANWIDYAIKTKNATIGDTREAVFAHVPYPVPKKYKDLLFDEKGKPKITSVLETPIGNTPYCFLRYVPTILMPAACFYAIDYDSYYKETHRTYQLLFGLYATIMHFNINECSFLVIKDCSRFIDELKQSVLISTTMSNNLSSASFSKKISLDNCLLYNGINYDCYDYDNEFFDLRNDSFALFCKDKSYKGQHEYRIVINNIRFAQMYPKENYNYLFNTLKVQIPHLKEYSELIIGGTAKGIEMLPFDDKRFFLHKI